MSKLSAFCGKRKEYKIGENKLEIGPLKLKDIDIIISMQDGDPAKQGIMMKKLIQKTLEDAVPDANESEINEFAVTHFKEISEAIMDVNGLAPAKKIDSHVKTLIMTHLMLDDPLKQPGDISDEVDKIVTPAVISRFKSLINEVLSNERS